MQMNPWSFLLAAVASSWAPWLLALVGTRWLPHPAITALQMLGPVAVAAVAVLFCVRAPNPHRLADLLASMSDPTRISPGALAASLLLLPATAVAAAGFAAAGGAGAWAPGFAIANAARPLLLLKALAYGLVVVPIVEEAGWRGVALGALQERLGALRAALTLACIHALWHLPMFFFGSGYLHDLGVFTPGFWRFLIDIVAFDVIAAALYNACGSSVLAAILLHVSFNAAGSLVQLSSAAQWLRALLDLGAALGLIALTQGRLFRRRA